MRSLFFLFCLLVTSASFGQKIVEDKVDDFENYRKVKTGNDPLVKNKSITAMVAVHALEVDKQKDTSFTLYLFFRPSRVTSLSEKENIILKFEDGSVDKLPYEGNYSVKSSGEFMGSYVNLNEALRDKIQKMKITKIRIETSNQNVDFDLEDKYQSVIPTMVTLVEERIVTPYNK